MPLSYTNEKLNDFQMKTVEFVRIPSDRSQIEIIPSLTFSSRAVDLKNAGPIFGIHKRSTTTSNSDIEDKS